MHTLRPYQKAAVEKLLWAYKLEGADLAILPTGAGKSLIIAELAHKLNCPILILQPNREILEQNYNKLSAYVDKSEIGIYSASMDRKDLGFYTLATIQSIYKTPEIFKNFGTVIIDECHLVDPKNLEGMYSGFIHDLSELRGIPVKVIGLSATPWRMALMYRHDERLGLQAITTTKLINRMKNRFWHRIVFNMSHAELVEQKYLVPLRYLDKSIIKHNDIPLNVSHSEFDLEAFEKKIIDKKEEIIDALFFAQALGKSVLVFCSSVAQAEELQSIMEGSVVVTAKTKAKERALVIEGFRNGSIQTVFNVGVMTTGYDHPSLDCIVLLRPTRSLGLYSQMLGRGCRTFPGKKFCRIIDLTGNVKGMGRIETIQVVRRENGQGRKEWQIASESNSAWHNWPLDSFLIAPKREKTSAIISQSEILQFNTEGRG